MQSKFNLSTRTARPHTLASAFGGLLRAFGARASDADLAARWDEIMGTEISSIAKLSGITKTRDKKFNIAVRAANPAYALQLSYMVGDIAARIDKYFGRPAVNKVTIRK